jgi:hypothetical protein
MIVMDRLIELIVDIVVVVVDVLPSSEMPADIKLFSSL